jgi:hypothetical protein
MKRGLAGVRQIAANRARYKEQWRSEAREAWPRLRQDPAFMLGLGLYWGEGTKSARSPRLALTNSDPGLLRAWLAWCRHVMPDVPLDYSLIIHDDAAVAAAQAFWTRELGVNVRVISIAVSRASRRRGRQLPHGTLKVRAGRGGIEWLTKMLVWLDLARRG